MSQSEKAARNNAHPSSRFARLRLAAKQRDLAFAITIEEYRRLIDQPCAYCGGIVDRYGGGLDRLELTRGYEASNVVPSCGLCNFIRRGYFTHAEMLRIGEVIRAIRLERGLDDQTSMLMDYAARRHG